MEDLPDILPFRRRLDELSAQMAEPSFYANPRRAAEVTREQQRLAQLVAGTPLEVTGDRGFTFAEATAGGVPLTEVRLETMESRICPGLFLAGEVLDVDGRIGGFNFQWAWASGFVAGTAAGATQPAAGPSAGAHAT